MPTDWPSWLWKWKQDVPHPNIEWRRARDLVEILAYTTERAAEHRAAYKLIPHKASQAAREQAESGKPEGTFTEHQITAFSVPWYLINAAEDHLCSMRFAVGRGSAVGAAVLARSALEMSARAWWHLDPSIDLRERMRRGIAERIESNLELDALEDQRGEPAPEKTGLAIAERVASEAASLGFDVQRTKKGRLLSTVDGEIRPGSGHLIADMMKTFFPNIGTDMGMFMWKYTSALAHGTMFALMGFYEAVEHPFDEEGVGAIPKVDVSSLELPVTIAALGHAHAFLRMTRLFGWDSAAWNEWLEKMQIKLIRERSKDAQEKLT